jgi:hypothetical protein
MPLAQHNHGLRIDTHRITLMEDEASAPEGGYPPGYGWRENQGRYIEPVPRQKEEVGTAAKVAGVLLAVSIGLVGAFALVAWALEP